MHPRPQYMKAALMAAKTSSERGNYPIGAVIVRAGQIVATGYGRHKELKDPVDTHAEIDAIHAACKVLDSKHLDGCTLYTSHEPCPMCMSAIIWANIEAVVFSVGMPDIVAINKRMYGNNFSWRQINIRAHYIAEHSEPKVKIFADYMRDEGLELFRLVNG